MKNFILCLFLLLVIISANSQTTILKDKGSWLTLSNSVKLSDKVYFGSVIQMRRVGFFENTQGFLIMPGISYKLSKNISVGVGYLWYKYFTAGVLHSPINKEENRIWQHLTINSVLGKYKLNHRFMLEERFKDAIILNNESEYIIDGISYSQRFRYRMAVVFNLLKLKNNKIVLGKLSNEIRIRFQTGLSEPDFDQNNLEALLGYQLLGNSKIWVGYGRFYYKANGTKFVSNNILHATLSCNFDITKKNL
jgi:hypothetical protein